MSPKEAKNSLDLGSEKEKIEQLPCVCESFAFPKSYSKEQNKDTLFLDFEYR